MLTTTEQEKLIIRNIERRYWLKKPECEVFKAIVAQREQKGGNEHN